MTTIAAQATTLHCIGAGRAARTLLRLFYQHRQFVPGHIMNRTLASARQAVAFIGAGTAASELPSTLATGGLLLGLPDSELERHARLLAGHGIKPAFAFHLSASQPASVLDALDCPTASFHPARAFAQPQHALQDFAGTWCVAEGEPRLAHALAAAFRAIGARVSVCPRLRKPLYHAAAMCASNGVLGALDLAERLAHGAGLEAAVARALLNSLAAGAVANSARAGPAQSLTGPIERGDEATVLHLMTALDQTPGHDARAWSRLMHLVVSSACNKGAITSAQAELIEKILNFNN